MLEHQSLQRTMLANPVRHICKVCTLTLLRTQAATTDAYLILVVLFHLSHGDLVLRAYQHKSTANHRNQVDWFAIDNTSIEQLCDAHSEQNEDAVGVYNAY